jgi:outer membrane lipoprotein-sorting protein
MTCGAGLLLSLCATAASSPAEDRLDQIWNGVQQAQRKITSGCGKLTETRTSLLFVKPRVFRGEFCADGLKRFAMHYSEPEPVRLRFDGDLIEVSTGGDGLAAQVFEVGQYVRRTQGYFSRENSLANLKREFAIETSESADAFELRFTPRGKRFAARLQWVSVRLRKRDYTPAVIEIEGRSGVHSVFKIDLTGVNTKIDESIFRVSRPRNAR